MHGGIIATLLDATMIQSMHNAFGGNPLTCKLDIRYREVVQIDTAMTVTACITSRRGIHCWAHATIMQKDRLCATARGTFKLVESGLLAASRWLRSDFASRIHGLNHGNRLHIAGCFEPPLAGSATGLHQGT